jgi:hypothetical protein
MSEVRCADILAGLCENFNHEFPTGMSRYVVPTFLSAFIEDFDH